MSLKYFKESLSQNLRSTAKQINYRRMPPMKTATSLPRAGFHSFPRLTTIQSKNCYFHPRFVSEKTKVLRDLAQHWIFTTLWKVCSLTSKIPCHSRPGSTSLPLLCGNSLAHIQCVCVCPVPSFAPTHQKSENQCGALGQWLHFCAQVARPSHEQVAA